MRMNRTAYLFFFGFVLMVGISACEKEEPLSAREDLAGAQEFDININSKDSSIFGGGGGGTGGGGGNTGGGINEYFRANVNGASQNYNVYSYTDNGSSVIFSGTNSATQFKINFSILGSLSSGQTLQLDGSPNSSSYRDSTRLLISNRGTLFIDTLGVDFIRGSFSFDAKDQNNPLDSVRVTNGTFQFEI